VSEIVNLRMARKQAARARREAEAAANRAKHGISKTERAQRDNAAEKIRAILEGAKRDPE
jgi:hypothetical protein